MAEQGVILSRAMKCVENGVPQYATEKPVPNPWPKSVEEGNKDYEKLMAARRHHPNVDMYRCPHCGAIICAE